MADILATAMRITVWSINYYPELVGIGVYNTDLCAFLAEAGHDVTMVTGFAYYPTWKKLEGDTCQLYRTDTIDTKKGSRVRACRCWLYVPTNPTVPGRVLHEFSFIVTSFLKLLTLPRSDVYFVVLPPLFLGVAAWLLALIKSAPCVLHVQDLQPDAAVSLKMLKPGLLVNWLYAFERFAYDKATLVSSISDQMCQKIKVKGVPQDKIMLLPNWVTTPSEAQLPPKGNWKRDHAIDLSMPIVSYAGNLGVKQGLDLIIEVAKNLQNKERVLFVIAGNGGNEGALKQIATEHSLTNVLFADVLP